MPKKNKFIDPYCDTCIRNAYVKAADGFCPKCSDFVCQECKESHEKLTPIGQHKLLTGSAMPARQSEKPLKYPSCELHSELEDRYCLDHGEVVCAKCSTKRHPHCDVKSILVAYKSFNISAEGQSFKGTANNFLAHAEQIRQSVEENLHELEAQKDELIKESQTFREETINQINQSCDDFETKVFNTFTENHDKLSEKHTAISSIVSDIEYVLEDLERQGMKTLGEANYFLHLKNQTDSIFDCSKKLQNIYNSLNYVDMKSHFYLQIRPVVAVKSQFVQILLDVSNYEYEKQVPDIYIPCRRPRHNKTRSRSNSSLSETLQNDTKTHRKSSLSDNKLLSSTTDNKDNIDTSLSQDKLIAADQTSQDQRKSSLTSQKLNMHSTTGDTKEGEDSLIGKRVASFSIGDKILEAPFVSDIDSIPSSTEDLRKMYDLSPRKQSTFPASVGIVETRKEEYKDDQSSASSKQSTKTTESSINTATEPAVAMSARLKPSDTSKENAASKHKAKSSTDTSIQLGSSASEQSLDASINSELTFRKLSTAISLAAKTTSSTKITKLEQITVEVEDDTSVCLILGIDVTEDGNVILLDRNNRKVKMFSPDGVFLVARKMTKVPEDLAVLDNSLVAVSAWNKSVVMIDTSAGGHLAVKRTLTLEYHAWAIAGYRNNLIVTCSPSPNITQAPSSVRMIDLQGKVKWSVAMDSQGIDLFQWAGFLTTRMGSNRDTVIVTDQYKQTITVLDAHNGNVEKVCDVVGKTPKGVTCNEKGEVFVCYDTGAICKWSKDMERERCPSGVDMKSPHALAYDKKQKQILVTSSSDITLYSNFIQRYHFRI